MRQKLLGAGGPRRAASLAETKKLPARLPALTSRLLARSAKKKEVCHKSCLGFCESLSQTVVWLLGSAGRLGFVVVVVLLSLGVGVLRDTFAGTGRTQMRSPDRDLRNVLENLCLKPPDTAKNKGPDFGLGLGEGVGPGFVALLF